MRDFTNDYPLSVGDIGTSNRNHFEICQNASFVPTSSPGKHLPKACFLLQKYSHCTGCFRLGWTFWLDSFWSKVPSPESPQIWTHPSLQSMQEVCASEVTMQEGHAHCEKCPNKCFHTCALGFTTWASKETNIDYLAQHPKTADSWFSPHLGHIHLFQFHWSHQHRATMRICRIRIP